MRTISRLFLVCALLVSCGCTSSSQTPGTTQGQTATGQPATTATEGVTIEFSSDPDPLKSGDNTFEVMVTQPDGKPIADAAVMVVFTMPAMPAMNMPAMRTESRLTHVDGGRYQGMGQLSMAGTWNVTVTATRDGEPIGRRTFSIVAK